MDKLAERKAKKDRRAAMSFNAHGGSGPTKYVRPESPGARQGGAAAGGVGSVGGDV